jgi:cobalt-precorrin 5A hydrolase/precorrin-3B C17-methyltransferase
MRTPVIGQLTNSPASRTRADTIDDLLGETLRFDGPAHESLPKAWATCDLIVSHLALGATTRLVAPLLADKKTDPGVVVIDEAGRFCIPLVGGHAGGANDLACRIADGIGATPVLTTATDARGIPGLDTLGWATSGDLAGVTRAMLDGLPVEVVRTQPWPLPPLPLNVAERGVERLVRRGTRVTVLPRETPVARIVVSDAAATGAVDDLPTVFLHPRSLVVGVGCNRGTPAAAIAALVEATLAEAGLARQSVVALATVDAKADEPGLLELATSWEIPLSTYPAGELARYDVPNPSAAPAAAVGTPSVAEASVLAWGADLVVTKRKSPEVTCAIGRRPARGRLTIVGLGPGAEDLLTPRARTALTSSALVVGYRPYVEQVRHLLRPGTEVYASAMGTEEERTAFAIDEARKGRSVALVAGGDPAIYAMASPALEQGTEGIDVQVVPGVTAELAASAVLGAPLGHDHVTLSLSDLHTDWAVIEHRLHAAAEGDFVVALYNPRSRTRVTQLPRAIEILGEHRPGTTPVAVVTDASRPAQRIRVTSLEDFDPATVDMHSIVIVGSSSTRMVPTGDGDQFMVTPRDYHWMNA